MWWVMLGAALAGMWLLQRVTAAGPLDGRAALALGGLLVAAYAGGELARRMRLPRITGFLLAAFAAGPGWLGLVRADELEALRFVANGALVLLAFAAGCELRLAALRAGGTALLRLTAGATVFPFLAVGGVALTVSPWFPLTAHQPFRDAAAVALLLAVVAAVSSPALTMAVIAERGARGPVPRTVLGVTVAQHLVAVVVITVVLAVLQPLTSPGAIVPGTAERAGVRLAGSLGAGALLGCAIARYRRVTRRDAILLLVALAFVAAQAVRMLGVEATLMAVAAGFCAGNVWPAEGDRLRGDLHQVALPVSLLFFAVFGAGLRLGELRALWPWALLFAALRFTGLRAGMWWATRHPAVGPRFAAPASLGLISQAGLALWIAGLARQAFPEWGISLEALLTAMIGVHAVAGPVAFGRAVRTTDDVSEGDHGSEEPRVPGPAVIAGSGV